MKKYLLTVLICMGMLQNFVYAQVNKINATYSLNWYSYLTIAEDSFKLYIATSEYSPYVGPIYIGSTELSMQYGLNRGDSILSEGKVEYETDNFIKLTSKDYERESRKNIIVIDSIDSSLNDSIRFNFIFPFDGKYKIILGVVDVEPSPDVKPRFTYELRNRKEFLLPVVNEGMYRDGILSFYFTIFNQTSIDEYPHLRNYPKNIEFNRWYSFTAKNKNSNSFEISIPDLTNSYFNRRLVDGEYIKVDEDRDRLYWNNERHRRCDVDYYIP